MHFFLDMGFASILANGRDLELMLISWGEIALYAPQQKDRKKPTIFAKFCDRDQPRGKKSLSKTCGRLSV
jgi:hypothetical protein